MTTPETDLVPVFKDDTLFWCSDEHGFIVRQSLKDGVIMCPVCGAPSLIVTAEDDLQEEEGA